MNSIELVSFACGVAGVVGGAAGVVAMYYSAKTYRRQFEPSIRIDAVDVIGGDAKGDDPSFHVLITATGAPLYNPEVVLSAAFADGRRLLWGLDTPRPKDGPLVLQSGLRADFWLRASRVRSLDPDCRMSRLVPDETRLWISAANSPKRVEVPFRRFGRQLLILDPAAAAQVPEAAVDSRKVAAAVAMTSTA